MRKEDINSTVITNVILLAIFILFVWLLVGCKSTKKTIETHSTDTIYKSEVIKVTPQRLNELVIKDPCNEVGELMPFFFTVNNGNDKIVVKSIHDTIYVSQKVDSTVQKTSSEKEIKTTTSNAEEVIVKYRMPKWCWYLLLYSILITAYVFRRFIPYLNLIP